MKILVVGGNGLLGRQLMLNGIAQGHEMHGTFRDKKIDIQTAAWHQLDVSDFWAISTLVPKIKPDSIIYTAAFHVVDDCEKDYDAARTINTIAPLFLADWCSKNNAHFTFISSDYVFDGYKKGPYSVEDQTQPFSIYAITKYETERKLLKNHPISLICRTSVVYGWHPHKSNFVLWLIKNLKDKHPVDIVDDQYSCPTLANDLAAAILKLTETRANGIYHTSGSECMNRYDFSVLAAEVFGLDSSLIHRIKTRDLKQLAIRPMNGCLAIDKLKKTGVSMSNTHDGLLLMRNEIEVAGGIIDV